MRAEGRRDIALAALLFTVGTAVASSFMLDVGVAYFYQAFMPSAVLSACGRLNLDPVVPIPALLDFLLTRNLSFDCDTLPQQLETGPINPFAQSHYYLLQTISLTWKLMGVSYRQLWPLAALLYGFFALSLFVLFRSFFNCWIAAIGALILTLSPSTLAMLVLLRDFAKAPFIIGVIALLIRLLKPDSALRLGCLSAICGLLIGFGIGFRTDVGVMLIPGLITLALFARPLRYPTLGRVICVLALLSGTLVAAMPMLRGGMSGGFGFTALQGLTVPYTRYLGITPTVYDIGDKYSDEWTFSSITADLRRYNSTAYDEAELASKLDVSQAVTRSTNYLIAQAPNFLADFTIRALAAARHLVGFYGLLVPEMRAADAFALPPIANKAHVTSLSNQIVAPLFYHQWTVYVGPFLLAIFFLYIWSTRGVRVALAVATVLAVLLAYPAVQFSFRHVFFLEFVPWLGVLAVISLLHKWRLRWRAAAGLVAALSVGGLTIYGILFTLRTMQTGKLVRAIEHDLASAVDVPIQTQPLGEMTLLSWSMPDRHRAIVEGLPDSLIKGETKLLSTVISGSDRIVIRLSEQSCNETRLKIQILYQKREMTWQPFDREIDAPLSHGGTTLILPAFYRASQHIAGIAVPSDSVDCVAAIQLVEHPSSLTSGFTAILPSDWRSLPLYQRYNLR